MGIFGGTQITVTDLRRGYYVDMSGVKHEVNSFSHCFDTVKRNKEDIKLFYKGSKHVTMD